MQAWLRIVQRHFWLDLIERAWRTRSVMWLAGIRRVGKTCHRQTFPKVGYFDCEFPRTRPMLPYRFLTRKWG
jgi:hypothetical protein